MFRRACLSVVVAAIVVASMGTSLVAQRGQSAPPAGGRAQAPYDITGYWVALVTDDWRYRMLTPPKGNADYLPVTPEARKAIDAWDPAKDEAAGEACRGYGAAGVMRLPGRMHITWAHDSALQVEMSAGTQTRTFTFGPPPAPGTTVPAAGTPSWQGTSLARWTFPPGGRGRAAAPTTGQLTVVTTGLRPGYVRKNGVPYSANAVITENFVRLVDEGDEFLVVTTSVDDPRYFAQPYVKTYQFKKQADAAGWNPTPCSAR